MATQVNVKTPLWQVRAYQNWVKTVLISEIVEATFYVCEFCCGTGLEIGKWARAHISKYTGIDSNAAHLDEAKERWLQKNKPFPAEFKEFDPFKDIIEPGQDEFDVITCFDGMQHSIDTEATMKLFLKNVSTNLRKGGVFLGMLPDSSELWYKSAQKAGLKGPLWSVKFAKEEFTLFGTEYTISLTDNTTSTDYLIHFPTFIKEAKEVGLRMLEIKNLNEFYDDNNKNYNTQLKALGVFDKKTIHIDKHQKEVIGIYLFLYSF